MVRDIALTRTLIESCNVNGFGNTKRMRDSIINESLMDNFEKKNLND